MITLAPWFGSSVAPSSDRDKEPMHRVESGTSSSQRSRCSESVSSLSEYQLPAWVAVREPDIFRKCRWKKGARQEIVKSETLLPCDVEEGGDGRLGLC